MQKKVNIVIDFDTEKLSALKIYLEDKGTSLEREISIACEALYQKTVPATVRAFLDLRAEESKSKKSKDKSTSTPIGNRGR